MVIVEKRPIKNMTKTHRIDDIDVEIVRHLQEDGRRSYADIANEMELAPSTIQQRANRLVSAGLLKIRAVTDPIAMGVPVVAAVALKVDGAIIADVADELAKFEEVGYVVICAGSHDIQIEIACRDNEHLLETITDISRIDGVRSTVTYIYLKIVKNTYQWGIPRSTS